MATETVIPLVQCICCGTYFALSLSASICKECGKKIAVKTTGMMIDVFV